MRTDGAGENPRHGGQVAGYAGVRHPSALSGAHHGGDLASADRIDVVVIKVGRDLSEAHDVALGSGRLDAARDDLFAVPAHGVLPRHPAMAVELCML